MASFVLFLFTVLLLPVARSEDPIQCGECFTDPKTCGHELKNCTSQTKCLVVSASANLSIGHDFIKSFARSCEDPANHLPGSFHFDFGDKRILDYNSKVCNETEPECNVGAEEKDPMRIYENGKSCPKCYRTGYENCASDGEVLCLGDLEDCADLNGEISNLNSATKIPFAGKGCVSNSVCNLKGKSFRRGSYTFTFKNLKCSKANGALSSLRHLAFTLEKKDLGPQVAFFFPCILGVLAVKILS